MYFSAQPSPNPSGSPISTLFYYCYYYLHDCCVVNAFGYNFNLWDVFVWAIVLSLLGYVLGKLLNPWGHEHND